MEDGDDWLVSGVNKIWIDNDGQDRQVNEWCCVEGLFTCTWIFFDIEFEF